MKKNILLIFMISFCFSFSQNDSIIVSHQSGFYDSFFLKAHSNFGELVYEINGDEARINSKKWKDSIKISETKVISLGLKLNNKIIYTRSFLYLIDYQSTFPVLSISTNPDNLYDPYKGIYVRGANSYMDTVNNRWANANFLKKWERKSKIIYIDTNGVEVINQNAGLRIFGGMTRFRNEKSLRIIARDIYGEKRFSFPFFKYRDNDKYKHLVIRNSGGDAYKTRFKDVLSTQLSKNLDIDIQEFQPINLFINGKLWGVYNLRERIGQHYLKYNFNAKIDSLNLLQGRFTQDHGSNTSYKKLRSYVIKNNLEKIEVLDSLKKMMDLRNFIDFNVAQIYLCNTDYRGNIRFWQHNDNKKFRWIMYDTDLGFGRPSYNFLKDRLSEYETVWHNPQWSTLLLRKILTNKKVKNDFINQVCHSLATVFKPKNVNRVIDSLRGIYKPELMQHFKYVNGDSAKWEKNVQFMRDFANLRPKFYFKHVKNQFNLKDSYYLNIKVNSSYNGDLMVNGNLINDSLYNGKFFKEIPLPIEAKPNPLYNVVASINGNLVKNDKQLFSSIRDTILNHTSDTVNIKIDYKYIGDSEWLNKIIINEVGILSDNEIKNWVELYSPKNKNINLENWKLILPNGELLHLNNELKSLEVINFLNNQLSDEVYQSIYLIDNKNKFVDSIHWENSFSKNPFFIERATPLNKKTLIKNGTGSPNGFNPQHLIQIEKKKSELLEKLLATFFFFLILIIKFKK